MVWAVGIPIFVMTGRLLGGAADIYVVVSVVLLLAQRAILSGQLNRLVLAWRRARRSIEIVPLSDVEGLAGCGNKALRLGRLKALGMEVPNGVVLTDHFLTRFCTASPQWRRRALDRVWRKVAAKQVAVRSSASAEDGVSQSFAGVFESELDVDREHLETAIMQVLNSFGSERARSYGADQGVTNILIQHMVEAEYAGVLFTHDPASDGHALIELVRGTADKLVAGIVPPDTFRFGRLTSMPVAGNNPPIDLRPLLAMGQRAERHFGAPQDIEWTYVGGRFYLVQSRDITQGDGPARQ